MIDPEQLIEGFPFKWSNTRHDCWERCRRKYFYQYYAATANPELQRLKKLSALTLWAGTLVHDFAEAYLKTEAGIVAPARQEELIAQVLAGQMPQDWRYSLAGTKPFRLWEHEYEVSVSDFEKRVTSGLVATCLRNWFRSPVLEEAYAVGKSNWLSIEAMLDWKINGVPVTGAMDFAYRRANGRVRICDWKTGRTEGKLNRAQVEGYATYAVQKGWAVDLAGVTTTLCYLAIPLYKDESAEGSSSAEFITKSATDMMAATHEGNKARMSEFDQCGQEWECRRCQFRKVCFPNWKKLARKS